MSNILKTTFPVLIGIVLLSSCVTARRYDALREKYRIGLGLFHLFGRREIGRVTLEVRPAEEDRGEEKAGVAR